MFCTCVGTCACDNTPLLKGIDNSHQEQFQKNLINRFKENLKNTDFGLKNALYPILVKI